MNEGREVSTWIERMSDGLLGAALDPLLPQLGDLLAVTMIVVWVVTALREMATHHALAPHRRVRFVLTGVGGRARSLDELERWAAQLSRCRRRVRRFADRPAQAVRIRLESGPFGPQFTMEGSRLAEPILRDPGLPDVRSTPLSAPPNARGRHRSPSARPPRP